MGHRPRWYLPNVVYDETIRTEHGTFWLRPDRVCVAIVEGVLGKALQLYPGVSLHAYCAQVNHLHLMLSAIAPEQIPLFLDFVNSNIARQLNRLRRRSGRFWSRRAAMIPVVDEQAQITRLEYVLAQGPAAGLVASPKDWPGASSTAALLGDMRVSARYTSLDARRRNAKRAEPLPEAELAEDVSFTLAPLPVWAKLDPAARRAKHAELVVGIERAHAHRKVMGAAAVCKLSPNRRPKQLSRSPIPRCHASSGTARRRFDRAYNLFRDAYHRASERARRDPKAARTEIQRLYPPGAIAGPRWYIPPPEEFRPPWQRGVDDTSWAEVRL